MHKPLIQQKLFFFALDFFCILLAFIGAFYTRLQSFHRPDFPFTPYIENALWIIPIWLFLLMWSNKYSLQEKSWIQMLRIISIASFGSTMLFVLTFFFRREIFFSRAIILLIFLFGTVLLIASWRLERYWEHKKSKQQKDIIRILVIGANASAEYCIALLKSTGSRHQPVAILAPFGSTKKYLHSVPICGKLDALEQTVEDYQIDEILLCDAEEQIMNLLLFAEGRFLGFRVAPEIFGVFRENIAPELLSGKTFLTLTHTPLFGWGQFWKRGFDVFFSTVALLTLLPVFLLQKILKGSRKLFVKEKRVGAGGRIFHMCRYQKASLLFRNIPNILNIFSGEMSFVGPRPALPHEWKTLPLYFKRRMILRPGMLGFWQLKKIQGADDNFEKMFLEDMRYIQQWSFWNDIQTIFRSIWYSVRKIFHCKK